MITTRTTEAQHIFYGSARIGNDRFTLQDFGLGPRVWFTRYCEGRGSYEVETTCPVVSPDDLGKPEADKLHPMLVKALHKSREEGRRVVPIRKAKGRLEAILATLSGEPV